MDWRTYLRAEPEVLEDFRLTLEALQKRALRQMDTARSWEEVLEARGAKKSVDALIRYLTMDEQEAKTYARFSGQPTPDVPPTAQRRARSA